VSYSQSCDIAWHAGVVPQSAKPRQDAQHRCDYDDSDAIRGAGQLARADDLKNTKLHPMSSGSEISAPAPALKPCLRLEHDADVVGPDSLTTLLRMRLTHVGREWKIGFDLPN
jgi:hypothetical protein